MIDSRKLSDLNPHVAKLAISFVALAENSTGCKILVTSTLRDKECQDKLYAQGRNGNSGKIVTNAKGGESFHNYGLAFDIVPVVDGKPVWDTDAPVWQVLGMIGESCGLEWAGRWEHFKEFPHFQATGGLTIAELKNGESPNFA